jgi:hypothetical protein
LIAPEGWAESIIISLVADYNSISDRNQSKKSPRVELLGRDFIARSIYSSCQLIKAERFVVLLLRAASKRPAFK